MNNTYRVCLSVIVIVLVGNLSNAQVTQAWAVKYNGAGNYYDYAYAMTIDRSGNTYVTGEAHTGANYDCTTIKYNSDGDTVWVRLYNGPDNSRDIGWAVAVDTAGNVYVTGASYGTTNYDIATIKYDAAGVQQWVRRYDGPGHGADEGTDIAVDASGNVYVTGHNISGGPSFLDDYVTIKYNSSGTQQWATPYAGPAGFQDVAYAIALDNSGNVYVTGRSSGSGTAYDYATIKYNSAGVQQWAARYDNSLAHLNDYAYSIAVDISGNVYVTGSSQSSISHEEYATIKYNSAGTQQWLARSDSAGGVDDAYALVSDGGNGIFVTGAGRNPAPPYSFDYLTIRYNASTGDTVWTARYNGPANGDDYSLSIALDRFGNVFVTGYSAGLTNGVDFATLRYDSSGVQQWVQRYTTDGNYFDIAVSVAVDTLGNVYVAGRGTDVVESGNYITVKYHDTSLPVPVELTSFSATVNGADVKLAWNTATEVNNYGFEIERKPLASAISGSASGGNAPLIGEGTKGWGRVGFVEGNGTTNAPKEYSFTEKNLSTGRYSYRLKQIDRDGKFKYSQSVEMTVNAIPIKFGIEQNFPNPFNPSTTIRYGLPDRSSVRLSITNTLGQQVAVLENGEREAGYHEVQWDANVASGIYFYCIEVLRLSNPSERTLQVKKMLLLR